MGTVGEDAPSVPDFVRLLHAKEERAHSLQLQLEEERRLRRASDREAHVQRQQLEERHKQQSDELGRQVRASEEKLERQRDEYRGTRSGLAAQLEAARQREAELLKRNDELVSDVRRLLSCAEADHAEKLALHAKVDALQAEIEELRAVLRTSDEVTRHLRNEAMEQMAMKEKVRSELGEMHVVERAGRESSKSQHERLNAQCEALARQASEQVRKVDDLEAHSRRTVEAHSAEVLEQEKARRQLQDRYCEVEAKLARSNEHTSALNDEICARKRVEATLHESAAALEDRIEEQRKDAHRLQKELLDQRMATDARAQEVDAGKIRERALKDTISALEDRTASFRTECEANQAALLAVRSQVQTTDLELQGANESIAAGRREMARAVASEQDALRDSAARFEDRVALRDQEIQALQDQLRARRDEINECSENFHRAEKAHAEHTHDFIAEIGSWKVKTAAHSDTIERLRSEHQVAEAATEQLRRRFRDSEQEFTSELTLQRKRAAEEASRAADEAATAAARAASKLGAVRREAESERDAERKQWRQEHAEERDFLRQEAQKEVQAERGTVTQLRQHMAKEQQRLMDQQLRLSVELRKAEEGRLELGKELAVERDWRAAQEARAASAKNKEVMTSPRLLATLKQEPNDQQSWSGEIAAMHRSNSVPHALAGPASRGSQQQASAQDLPGPGAASQMRLPAEVQARVDRYIEQDPCAHRAALHAQHVDQPHGPAYADLEAKVRQYLEHEPGGHTPMSAPRRACPAEVPPELEAKVVRRYLAQDPAIQLAAARAHHQQQTEEPQPEVHAKVRKYVGKHGNPKDPGWILDTQVRQGQALVRTRTRLRSKSQAAAQQAAQCNEMLQRHAAQAADAGVPAGDMPTMRELRLGPRLVAG